MMNGLKKSDSIGGRTLSASVEPYQRDHDGRHGTDGKPEGDSRQELIHLPDRKNRSRLVQPKPAFKINDHGTV
jgi:hypothetical protein